MEAVYSKAAVKVLSGLDRPTKQRIREAVQKIPAGDIVPLQGSPGSYRLRVGSWRIIFSLPGESEVLIEKIGPRGDVYK